MNFLIMVTLLMTKKKTSFMTIKITHFNLELASKFEVESAIEP